MEPAWKQATDRVERNLQRSQSRPRYDKWLSAYLFWSDYEDAQRAGYDPHEARGYAIRMYIKRIVYGVTVLTAFGVFLWILHITR